MAEEIRIFKKECMMDQIEYRPITADDEEQAIDIVSSTFREFVAPGFSDEGIAEFFNYANADAFKERSRGNHFTIVAQKSRDLIGLIEIRNNNHISLFFVRKQYQSMGVGKSLFNMAQKACLKNCPDLKKITVNASPNSVPAYQKMGFIGDDTEQCINGIRFVPMSLIIK
jgi:GNAT superfamily N-acetyltransferase